MTKAVVVNKSKGLFLPSDLRALSQTWDVGGGGYTAHAHTRSHLAREFFWLGDLAALMTLQEPVFIYRAYPVALL